MSNKTIIVLGFLILGAFFSYSQESFVNKAEKNLKDNKLSDAIFAIGWAANHAKSMKMARTWYIYGKIYKAALFSEEKIDRLDKDPFEESVRGFKTAMSLSKESDTYYTLSKAEIQGLWRDFMNKGTAAYQNNKHKEAIAWFDKSKFLFPKDTTAYLFAGIAAQAIKNDSLTLKNFVQLAELGSNQPSVYSSIIHYKQHTEKDNNSALEWAKKAVEKFPNNNIFKKQEVDLLIKTNKKESALTELKKAIKNEPNNANLYFNLGFLYETIGEPDNALEAYTKSISINPDYFDAQYNLGVYYFNRATDIYKASQQLSFEAYKKEGKAMENEANAFLTKALPYMEKSSTLKPKEPSIWNTLTTIYNRLGMDDKAKEALDKYDELMKY